MNRRWFIVTGLIALAVVMIVIVMRSSGEPRYQGRALLEWIEDSRIAKRNQYVRFAENGNAELDSKGRAATNAVYQIGTNALPTLIKWAFAKDSKLKAATIDWLNAHPSLHIHIRDADVWQTTAANGFELLGDKVEPAWSMIVKHSYSANSWERDLALAWLDSMNIAVVRSDGKDTLKTNAFLLPTALRLLKDPDQNVRHRAALILVQEYPREAEAAGVSNFYPNLTKCVAPVSVTNSQPVAK